MSYHFYLFCEQTNECVEVAAHVGNVVTPRIQANALQAFLTYHHIKACGAPLVIWEIDSIAQDRSVVTSLEEAAAEFESVGSYAGYQAPIMLWTEQNYRALSERAPGLAETLEEYAQAPGGGSWVRRTSEGHIHGW